MCFPTCPLSPDNEIDLLPPYLMYPTIESQIVSNPIVPQPAVAQPVPTV